MAAAAARARTASAVSSTGASLFTKSAAGRSGTQESVPTVLPVTSLAITPVARSFEAVVAPFETDIAVVVGDGVENDVVDVLDEDEQIGTFAAERGDVPIGNDRNHRHDDRDTAHVFQTDRRHQRRSVAVVELLDDDVVRALIVDAGTNVAHHRRDRRLDRGEGLGRHAHAGRRGVDRLVVAVENVVFLRAVDVVEIGTVVVVHPCEIVGADLFRRLLPEDLGDEFPSDLRGMGEEGAVEEIALAVDGVGVAALDQHESKYSDHHDRRHEEGDNREGREIGTEEETL